MHKIVLLVKMVRILMEVGINNQSFLCKEADNLLQLVEEELIWTTSWMMAHSQ
jgi:hypothetical protein